MPIKKRKKNGYKAVKGYLVGYDTEENTEITSQKIIAFIVKRCHKG